MSGSQEDRENRSPASLADFDRVQREGVSARLADMKTWRAPSSSSLVNRAGSTPQPSPDFPSKRTDSALVGSVMALIATFDAANVLPPEGSSQANQLIHGLIQLQSAVVKSQASALSEYVSAAVDHRFEMESTALLKSIHRSGLTSKVLEALLIYDQKLPIWDQPTIAHIFQHYNVSQPDWQLIEQIFAQAEAAYSSKGTSIHEVYEQWQSQMPGGR